MRIFSTYVCLLLFCDFAFEQTADGGIINNGADINIASGAYIYIAGGSRGSYVVNGDGELFGADEMQLIAFFRKFTSHN